MAFSDKPVVYKFGGTSVGSADRIRQVAQIVASAEGPVVVVVSAMAGVTDRMVSALSSIESGETSRWRTLIDEITQIHQLACSELSVPDEITESVLQILGAAKRRLEAVNTLGELTPKTRDSLLCVGEKMSVQLLTHALNEMGLRSVSLNADEFVETDGVFGNASPVGEITDRAVAMALSPLLSDGVVPVVTGYCGRSPSGDTVTLGRGGSDLTATIIGAAIQAREVTLWSDVPGVFTTDPRVVSEARVIGHLNYREAAEMSFYGAKVLHQRTMIPVARFGIPVRCRSTLEPTARGTFIDDQFTPGSHPVKACSTVDGQALISIEGKGMAGVPGVAGRVFGALARHDISVTMISQSSSEASIAFVVPDAVCYRAVSAAKGALAEELAKGDVEEVVVRASMALVAVVGLGMAQTPGVAARVFGALAKNRVNAFAIAQGASELNISVAIRADDQQAALLALHREFGLDRIDTGVDVGRHFDLVLLGTGR